MTVTCSNCQSTFRNVDRNEDGTPYLETTRCASAGCEVHLCRGGCEHLAFYCEGCSLRFCECHSHSIEGSLFCAACATEETVCALVAVA